MGSPPPAREILALVPTSPSATEREEPHDAAQAVQEALESTHLHDAAPDEQHHSGDDHASPPFDQLARLYVAQIPKSMNEAQLKPLFDQVGAVDER